MKETKPAFIHVDKDMLDFSSKKTETLKLSFSPSITEDKYFVVIDIYSVTHHVHPEGHIGWWRSSKLAGGEGEQMKVELSRDENGFSVSFPGGGKPEEQWVNPECERKDEEVLAVHIVLRNIETRAVDFVDVISLYQSKGSLKKAAEVRLNLESDLGPVDDMSRLWYQWPKGSTVHIVTPSIIKGDAIGNFCINMFRLFKVNDIPCVMYAISFDPTLRGVIKHTSELLTNAEESDVVLLNFSIFDPYLDAVSKLSSKNILFYQNITPPRMFQVYDAELAGHCAKAYEQHHLLRRFDAFMANSEFSGAAMIEGLAEKNKTDKTAATEGTVDILPNDITICPPLINTRRLDYVEKEEVRLPEAKTLLLYVGRVAPNKKVEDLINLYSEYHKLNQDSALIVAGKCALKGYANYIEYLLNTRYSEVKDKVHMLGHISDGQLRTLYESSSAFITMSEHEGFCVPLVEAMRFMPLFAFAQKAVMQTLGESGKVFHEKDFPVVASEINAVLEEESEHARIMRLQTERFSGISKSADGRLILKAIEGVIFKDAGSL